MPGETLGSPRVLYAPWRERYLRAMADSEKPSSTSPDAPPQNLPGSSGCFLRDYWLTPEHDEQNLVVLRKTDDQAGPSCGGLVMLNLYPYANGHLLVSLGESRPRILDYSQAQRAALWALVEDALAIMDRALAPQGINVGVNEGRAAGAGVPQHVHVHLVPRWLGDVNFMTVVGAVRVNPSAPIDMAKRYREAWTSILTERATQK
ncbi:MAG: HIT family protein [Phycisphaerales bacterium]